MDCELLIGERESSKSMRVLQALQATSPIPVKVTKRYTGNHELLMLWGIGREGHHQARDAHVSSGRHCAMWDMGYLDDGEDQFFRVSLDHQHPQAWLDRTPRDGARWEALGLKLEELADPKGHVLVIGMGHKSHRFLGTHGWELDAMRKARKRYPDREVRLRPKPHKQHRGKPIKEDLTGASLVVCRHSNVAVQAALWGVPARSEDGAAIWLQGKDYTPENRLDFLRRLAHWQYKTTEFQKAWDFLLNITAG